MKKKIFKIFFFILVIFCTVYFLYFKLTKKDQKINTSDETIIEKEIYNSNIMKNVKYTSTDSRGNNYTITALTGEIDFLNQILFF